MGDVAIAIVVVVPGGAAAEILGVKQATDATGSLNCAAEVETPSV